MAHTAPLKNTVVVYEPPRAPEPPDRVGTQTLVRQQPQRSRVREWAHWFVDKAVVPAVDFFGAEYLAEATPEQYRWFVRPLAHLFSQTIAKPAVARLSHALADAAMDPRAFKDSVKRVVTDPRAVVTEVMAMLPKSKAEIGKAAREMILGSTDAAASVLMLKIAAGVTGNETLTEVLKDAVPYLAEAVRSLVDFGLDQTIPLYDVAPADVPKVDDTLDVCMIWPATVTAVGDKLQGSYDATVSFKTGADPSAVLTGSAVVTTGPRKRILGIKKLTDAKLVIGGREKYELTGLATKAYGEHTGWALTATSMVSGKTPATLGHLTISPTGWIDGAFTREGKVGRLGGQASDGVELAPAVAPSSAAPLVTGPKTTTLAKHVDTAILGHHTKWLAGGGLAFAGWMTEHANLLPTKNPTPTQLGEVRTKTWLETLKFNPSSLLDEITSINLVPDFLRSGYPNLSFNPYELKIGHEPSLAFSMDTSIQLFEQIGPASASGLVIAWLPFAASPVQVRAGQLKFDTALVVDGLDIDPDGGVRSRHALLKMPLPRAFSLPDILLSADYLTVGRTLGFRSANLTTGGFTIANVITVDSFAVSVEKANRFTAATKGSVHLPGVSEMTFAGNVAWGGSETAEGSGTVKGTGIADRHFSAKQVTGTLNIIKGVASGTLSATDFAIEWNGYTLKTDASVTVDREGIEKLAIPKLEVWKAGVQVGTASTIAYDRTKGQLTVGKLALDLPEQGNIRATKDDKSGDTPQIVTTNLDLSSLVRKPDPADKTPKPKTEPEVTDTTPKLKTTLAVTNLGRVELGPDPAFLKLDFAKAKAVTPTTEGAIAAYVSGDFRKFKLKETLLQVEHSANPADVRVTLSGMSGTGYSLESATYDDGTLDVKSANIAIDKILGDNIPDALKGLKSTVKTSFTIDTRANRLVSLTANGDLNGGKLFDGALTVTEAAADIRATPGTITDGLTDRVGLTGNIRGTMTVKAYGVDATLRGSIDLQTGIPTLSGHGTKDNVEINVTDLTFVDGKPVIGTATVKISAPKSDIVTFRPSPSEKYESEEDRAKVIAWVTEAAPAKATPATAAPTSAAVAPTRHYGVHLPEIHVAGDTFVLKATDMVSAEGKDQTVSVDASASMDLGVLSGKVGGRATVRLGADSPQPDAKSLVFDVPNFTVGGLTLTGIHYEEGKLKVASAAALTQAMLGGASHDLGLDGVTWAAKNLTIDLARKTIGIEKVSASVADVSTLGGALTIRAATAEVGLQDAPLEGPSLISKDWALTLAATDARLGNDTLSITGSGRVVFDRAGFRNGEITSASLRAGIGEASIGKIALTPDGWNASDVKVIVGPTPTLGFNPFPALPAWLEGAADSQISATFPLAYKAKKLVWPSLSDVKIDVLKAGIKLPGIRGSFDRTSGKRKASFAATPPPMPGFSVNVQIPLAQGIGIEFGGSIEHEVSLQATDVDLQDDEDRLAFAGKVAGKAALKGRLRVGVFGGVPALFTVSAGIYAGLNLKAVLAADATGAWQLPKTAGQPGSGAVQLYLSMSDSATKEQTMLTGEAGAYASVHVLGFGRTIEKPLANAEIASIFAHGFAELSTAHGLRLLPSGAFPTHQLRLNPALEGLLIGDDGKKAMAAAYSTVDRGVGKMEASEELLALDETTDDDAATSYVDLASALKAEQTEAEEAEQSSAATVSRLERLIKTDRKSLALAKKKLAEYEKDKKDTPIDKTLMGRAALGGDTAARLVGYEDHLGRAKDKTPLNATALQHRIDCKKQEIAALQERIKANEAEHLEAREQHTLDINATHKATKKAKLATLTEGAVRKDLAWRQRRLLEMYGTLQKSHKNATNRAAQRAGKVTKLEEDKRLAERHVERLTADAHANATEKKFWTEQLKYVTAELKRVKEEAMPDPIALPARAKEAVARAAEAQPEAQAKLSDQVMKELGRYEKQIEVTTRKLSENMQALAKLGDGPEHEQARALEQARVDLLADLHKAQTKLQGALAREDAMG